MNGITDVFLCTVSPAAGLHPAAFHCQLDAVIFFVEQRHINTFHWSIIGMSTSV